MRVGIGYDIHALKAGRPLVLGGVTVPFSKGLAGHSDGDVVLHAIVDAVLGALGEDDLGTLFPDQDQQYKDASSFLFVDKVRLILKKRKLKIAHMDATLIAERPKLFDYKKKIRERISRGFGVPLSSVGFKAKTNEGFDAIGKGQAMACLAVVSLKKG